MNNHLTNKTNYNHVRLFFSTLLIAIVFLSFFNFSTVNVEAKKSGVADEVFDYTTKEIEDALPNIAWYFAKQIYGENTAYKSILSDVKFDFTGSSSSGQAAVSIWGFIQKTYELIKPIGIGLILLYFLLDIVEKSTHEQMSIEHFLKSTIKLVVAIAFISKGLEIMKLGLEFGNAIGTAIGGNTDAIKPDNTELETIYDALTQDTGIGAIGVSLAYICKLLIPYLIVWACKLVANFVLWGRMIELGVRGMLAPIGMADLFTEGTKGAGFRYFKKYLALCIQGVVIICILVAYNAIYSSIASNTDGEALVGVCVSSLTVITLLLKSQSIAESISG